MQYRVEIRETSRLTVASIREATPAAEFKPWLEGAFGELYGALEGGRAGDARPSGPPVVAYHAFGPHEIDAEVCVPVEGSVTATGRIRPSELPAATVAVTLHVGPYEDLGEAYEALTDWIADHAAVAAWPVREHYHNGPSDTASPAGFRTEIEMPFTRVAASVTA